MSSSMTLEEKFEALMKSYQTGTSSNNELQQWRNEAKIRWSDDQNAYLHKQLDKSMKPKQRILESPTGSNLDEPCEEAES